MVTRKRDGDGDGFVDDGLPTMRPYNPATDLIGESVDIDTILRASAGDPKATADLTGRADKNLAIARKAGHQPTFRHIMESTNGDKPVDPKHVKPWQAANKMVNDHLQKANTPTEKPEARPTADLAGAVFSNGGFTYDPIGDQFPTEGVAVAVPGHSVILTEDAFRADAATAIADYLRQMRADGVEDLMIGGWHDKEHGEVVLDRVEVVETRDEAMRLGADRGEQAVFDLATLEEIPTGGTGGRENIDIIGRSDPVGDGPPRETGEGPDGRGDRPDLAGSGDADARADGRPEAVAEVPGNDPAVRAAEVRAEFPDLQPEQVRASITDAAETPRVRVTGRAFDAIVADRAIRSAFEVGGQDKSEEWDNADPRRTFEERVYGVAPDAPAADRPTYVYGMGAGEAPGNSSIGMFGGIVIGVKPERVRDGHALVGDSFYGGLNTRGVRLDQLDSASDDQLLAAVAENPIERSATGRQLAPYVEFAVPGRLQSGDFTGDITIAPDEYSMWGGDEGDESVVAVARDDARRLVEHREALAEMGITRVGVGGQLTDEERIEIEGILTAGGWELADTVEDLPGEPVPAAPAAAPVAAMKPKRDGDGDGMVDDGTPLERPVIPGFDLDINGDVIKAKPKVPGGKPVPDDVAVKRGRVGNIDTPRLQARRKRLIVEVDDSGQFYKGGRHGFAMRAAELTVIESELVKRGDLKVRDRYTVSLKDTPEVPDWEPVDVPEGVEFAEAPKQYGDRFYPEVPILPKRLLEWAVKGGPYQRNRMTREGDFDGPEWQVEQRKDMQVASREALIAAATAALAADDPGHGAHDGVWRALTAREPSRYWLSDAIRNGPSPEEREVLRIVRALHDRNSDPDIPTQPVRRYQNGGDPFDGTSVYPGKATTGVTSWYGQSDAYGHPPKPTQDHEGVAARWEGDVPQAQVLGRFGDMDEELIVARDPEILDRLLGRVEANPFTPTDAPGELGGEAAPITAATEALFADLDLPGGFTADATIGKVSTRQGYDGEERQSVSVFGLFHSPKDDDLGSSGYFTADVRSGPGGKPVSVNWSDISVRPRGSGAGEALFRQVTAKADEAGLWTNVGDAHSNPASGGDPATVGAYVWAKTGLLDFSRPEDPFNERSDAVIRALRATGDKGDAKVADHLQKWADDDWTAPPGGNTWDDPAIDDPPTPKDVADTTIGRELLLGKLTRGIQWRGQRDPSNPPETRRNPFVPSEIENAVELGGAADDGVTGRIETLLSNMDVDVTNVRPAPNGVDQNGVEVPAEMEVNGQFGRFDSYTADVESQRGDRYSLTLRLASFKEGDRPLDGVGRWILYADDGREVDEGSTELRGGADHAETVALLAEKLGDEVADAIAKAQQPKPPGDGVFSVEDANFRRVEHFLSQLGRGPYSWHWDYDADPYGPPDPENVDATISYRIRVSEYGELIRQGATPRDALRAAQGSAAAYSPELRERWKNSDWASVIDGRGYISANLRALNGEEGFGEPDPDAIRFLQLLRREFLAGVPKTPAEKMRLYRASNERDPFGGNDPFRFGFGGSEPARRASSGVTSWAFMSAPDAQLHLSGYGDFMHGEDVPFDRILGRFGGVEGEFLVADDPATVEKIDSWRPGRSAFAATDAPGEMGGAVAPVEMDDTFRKVVAQRGSRVDAEQLQNAWSAAVADPDDLDAIRSALPEQAIRSWQQTYGANAISAMRSGKGGVPPLEDVLAHNARRLTETVPLTRDTLGANGMPSAAEIVEYDPAMAKWLGITERTSFGELRTAIARRPFANLLSDPNPDPQGVRYLKMLRRAVNRDVGRMGGSVELHRTNTQGTASPFDTKGGSGITSWTSDYATAAKYAKGGARTVTVRVDADRILAYDTFGIMASTGFWDFAGQDSYPLPGREVLVTSPEVIERLNAGVFPLLPSADAGAAPVALAAAVRKRDGDNDGFVDDGLPTMRPAVPLPDKGDDWQRTIKVGRARQGLVPGTTMPYPFAHDSEGYQFVGYHVTPDPEFDYDSERRATWRLPEDEGATLFTSLKPDHWSTWNGGQHAAEVWIRRDRDVRADGDYAVLQVALWPNDDVKVKKVVSLSEAVRNLRRLHQLRAKADAERDRRRRVWQAEVDAKRRSTGRFSKLPAWMGDDLDVPDDDVYARTPEDAAADAALGIYWDKTGNKETFVGAAKRDGDGDGMVDDGTPLERPWNPLTDIGKGRFAVGFKGQARRPAPAAPAKPKPAADRGPFATTDTPGELGAQFAKGRGDCFPSAVDTARKLEAEGKSNVRVVHGRPIYRGEGPGEADDGRFWHAWAEYDMPVGDQKLRMVVDRSNGGNVEVPDGLYYGMAGVNDGSVWSDWSDQPPVKRYTVTEAEVEAVRAKHWGPWGDDDPTTRNPFATTEPEGDSGYASSSKYPGMRPVTAEERKELRVEGRPIPPAWTDLFIATDPDAPMQARGVDAKGRNQYIYSTAHTEQAAAAKYARVKELAGRMPELDAAIERDAMDDPAAAATALIRHFGLRPGSTSDTKAKKKAYGATTLQARHVRQYPATGRTTLSFVGKSGVKITVSSRDPDIYRIVERWLGDKEGMVDLFPATDADVRAYIDANLGDGFKAKDLRTHLANVMALDMVSSMRRPTTQAKFKAARNKIADAVAKALGNTRAVTLSNYINPTVFAAWEGALPA